ncbi:hypothetical protein [Benzoatithermus flavus]|uniref:Uncharacterized protein n=1 Tax=Benzoatithermus flavus TaxID=3108223 RepID=A0ABU8XLK4_9PROT
MPLAAAGLLLAIPAAVALVHAWRREQRRARAWRAELFADALDLIEGPALRQDGLDYPVLRGRWQGLAVELKPIADTVAMRKLPSLWLQVTLTAPTGASGIADVLLRPLGVEYWSPASDLPVSVPTPASLPETAQIRLDHEGAASLLPLVAAHAALLARPATKELLITPKGVRLVVQLAEAERGSYLLFREARFAIRRIERAALEEMLVATARILEDVRRAMAGRNDGYRPTLDAAA